VGEAVKRYLGDSVYAETESNDALPGVVVLTTSDGENVSNRIVLEPEVVEALFTFLLDTVDKKIVKGETK
jgi:hypothetical protein